MKQRFRKRGWTTAFGIALSSPAAAEVCDKVRPIWNRADGPINQLEDLALLFNEPLGLTILALALAALLLRKTWVSAIIVTLLLAIAALKISTWMEADEVTNLAISEGCIAAPVLTTTTLLAVCAIISVVTWRSSKRRENAG